MRTKQEASGDNKMPLSEYNCTKSRLTPKPNNSNLARVPHDTHETSFPNKQK